MELAYSDVMEAGRAGRLLNKLFETSLPQKPKTTLRPFASYDVPPSLSSCSGVGHTSDPGCLTFLAKGDEIIRCLNAIEEVEVC